MGNSPTCDNWMYTDITGQRMWTLSAQAPSHCNPVTTSSYLSYDNAANSVMIRPVINITAGAKITSGSGTSNDPYIIS